MMKSLTLAKKISGGFGVGLLSLVLLASISY